MQQKWIETKKKKEENSSLLLLNLTFFPSSPLLSMLHFELHIMRKHVIRRKCTSFAVKTHFRTKLKTTHFAYHYRASLTLTVFIFNFRPSFSHTHVNSKIPRRYFPLLRGLPARVYVVHISAEKTLLPTHSIIFIAIRNRLRIRGKDGIFYLSVVVFHMNFISVTNALTSFRVPRASNYTQLAHFSFSGVRTTQRIGLILRNLIYGIYIGIPRQLRMWFRIL